jgi:hypothetical protein
MVYKRAYKADIKDYIDHEPSGIRMSFITTLKDGILRGI